MASSGTSEIIGRFGGAKALAGELGIPVSTVRNWPSMGIPFKWHLVLLDRADRLGISLSRAELLSTTSLKQAS